MRQRQVGLCSPPASARGRWQQDKNKMNEFTLIGILLCLGACNLKEESYPTHEIIGKNDKLEITYKGEGEAVEFKMLEGLQVNLRKESERKFTGDLEILDLDKSLFSYEFIVSRKDSTGKIINKQYKPESKEEHHFLWVGQKRDLNLAKSTNLGVRLKTIELDSRFLKEKRKLTIYTPTEESRDIPIIYLTDGQVLEYYAPYIDKLISEEKINPIKVIGLHSSSKNRFSEYIDIGSMEFKNHEGFYYQEVLNKIENEIQDWQGRRYIYGFSNGAAFCMYAGLNYPEMFEEIIAFSTACNISEMTTPEYFRFSKYPSFYLGSGRYEKFKDNKIFLRILKSKEIEVSYKEFISGHDYNVWKFEFLEYLLKRFGK